MEMSSKEGRKGDKKKNKREEQTLDTNWLAFWVRVVGTYWSAYLVDRRCFLLQDGMYENQLESALTILC